ncbi:site-specific integrase [uncultured Phascolarctobacterium sp.]|uniref:site-specific integrase n=1 Tax=uncultured Phascolarctobacterium sp. TaxID=512296 RepID=UPI00345850F0
MQKNLTENTLTSYEYFLKSLEKYLQSIGRLNSMERVTAGDIRGYFVEASKTMKGITQEGYYRRLKTFFSWLATRTPKVSSSSG